MLLQNSRIFTPHSQRSSNFHSHLSTVKSIRNVANWTQVSKKSQNLIYNQMEITRIVITPTKINLLITH